MQYIVYNVNKKLTILISCKISSPRGSRDKGMEAGDD